MLPHDVTQYLKLVDFPAGRDEFVRAAHQAGAPDDVVRALQAMPPVDYRNADEVVRSAHL